jgi:septum formation protein
MDPLQTWLAARRLILASGSPRRRELLEESGYRFEVVKPSESAECGVCSGETPPELVARLAFQKVEDVARRIEGQAVIVGCDTVAECAGQVLGKPANEEHARQMLTLLSGREHRVYSGLCVWDWPGAEPLAAVEQTILRMDKLSEAAIDEYLASGQWEGKAGAFGYQDRLGWIHILDGSESNVVGLPMERLGELLTQLASRPDAGE